MATATFAAGCFWGVEDHFQQIPGVLQTRVGYTGGQTQNPDYRAVCTGATGHAEAVEIVYDDNTIGYDDLLDAFWACHDPTQKNRQGPDIGTQYRSAIFTQTAEQARQAQQSLEAQEKEKRFPRPIATEINPATVFYPAEDEHQSYLKKRRASFS